VISRWPCRRIGALACSSPHGGVVRLCLKRAAPSPASETRGQRH